MLGVLAETGGALELHQQADPQRLQRHFVEALAAGQIADLDTDVIKHRPSLMPLGFFTAMEATTAPRSQWTFAQWGIVILAALQLAWAIAGLIAEPTFDFGDGASTQRVLGVDFNGVHALSGFLLFLPAFYFALKPRWAVLYAIYVAVALIVTGIWAIFSTSPAGIFTFPNNGADAILHIATGLLFLAIATIQLSLDRR